MSKDVTERDVTARERSSYGPIVAIASVTLSLLALSFPFVIIPAIRRYGYIPWMATPHHVINDIFKQLKNVKQSNNREKFVDLGSGDGRIVIAAAKNNFYGIGYELNPVLISLSYFNSIRESTFHSVTFKNSDFWNSDLDDVHVISCFGVNSVMDRLFSKILDAKSKSSRKDKTFVVLLFRFEFRPEIARKYLIYAKDELYIYHI